MADQDKDKSDLGLGNIKPGTVYSTKSKRNRADEELGVPKTYSELAEMTIKAENDGHDEAKEDKRMKAYRAVSAVSDLLGGLGNMIAVNNGAVPVSQENTMMDDYHRKYKEILDERKARNERHRKMRTAGIEADFRAAKEAQAMAAKNEANEKLVRLKNELAIKLAEKKGEINRLAIDAKAKNTQETNDKLYKAKQEYERIRAEYKATQDSLNRESRENIAAANRRAANRRFNAQQKNEWGKNANVVEVDEVVEGGKGGDGVDEVKKEDNEEKPKITPTDNTKKKRGFGWK